MQLNTVFIRFYKSFNDNYLRKNHEKAKPKPWELIDGAFYPYIEVPIEQKITAVVGANESGKSHLLSAIKKTISGKEISRSDFCRYSSFFTVKQNELKYPDFGSEWTGLSDVETIKVREMLEIPDSVIFNRMFLFRNNVNNLKIYLPEKGEYRLYKIKEEKLNELHNLLPKCV